MSAPSVQQMDCIEVEELLPLVAEGLIDPDSDPAVFEHLAGCDQCQASLEMHDLVTLQLSHGSDLSPASPRSDVIHFQLSRPLAMAASFLLVAMLGLTVGLGWQSSQDQLSTETISEKPETQILDVLQARSDDESPLIIIRHQDQTIVVPQHQIDNGNSSNADNNSTSVPVRY